MINFLISNANASEVAAEVAQPSIFQSIMPILMIFVVFYFFIIRPQSKKYKEQQGMINGTKEGDEVIILSGVFGKISAIENNETCMVEISKGNEIKIYKTAIVRNISFEERRKNDVIKTIAKK
ncbi:preprotein translocase subunit YajC [Candidatus Deianiraea vastatrix]|uniref:Sec translocon accessory complex subunit YajC n=1 Tax=Candidatus Deianiraea vastatrix TaxID=2163644 RepID=A0A5B8XEU4_9RICK|nr:preprotein translocase subunit YajC [Candidatus Deianiraea vastatrix]QED22851.1 Preprotein translocase subunit YajC [Candidatus Deianiraea vastatrix]